MGLCKCPLKKVTNQYCFEHRVNVCENCLVDEHQTCIVKSYLQWLDDSDYNPVCQLCQESLPSKECVRLVCYDVFHVSCLNEWATKLPANTAPAGYKCPICTSPIFPPSNLVSPVAEALRDVLSEYNWSRIGLGLPLIQSNQAQMLSNAATEASPMNSRTYIDNSHYGPRVDSSDRGAPDGHVSTGGSIISERYEIQPSSSQHRSVYTSSSVSRKHSESSSIFVSPPEEDVGENKYRRRPTLEWFNRWLRTIHRPSSRHHQALIGGRRKMILMLVILAFCSLLALFSYLGKGASNDPMLDPLSNPNIRVQED